MITVQIHKILTLYNHQNKFIRASGFTLKDADGMADNVAPDYTCLSEYLESLSLVTRKPVFRISDQV